MKGDIIWVGGLLQLPLLAQVVIQRLVGNNKQATNPSTYDVKSNLRSSFKQEDSRKFILNINLMVQYKKNLHNFKLTKFHENQKISTFIIKKFITI
jgi:hypothetical protein